VDAQLNALILRMLSPTPQERGTAGELAEAMEHGVAHSGPSADAPLFGWETLKPSEWTEEELAEAEHLGHRPRRRKRERVLKVEQADAAERAQVERREVEARAQPTASARQGRAHSWLTWLAAAMALGLWPEETGSVRTQPLSTAARSSSKEERDAVSLGDTARSSPAVLAKDSLQDAIGEELPKNPLPGQLKPDAKGRCPNKQVAINGGCWLKVDFVPEECLGNGFAYQGGCYVPFFVSSREPASAPREGKAPDQPR
jgi:hypothetical protein